MDLDASAQVDEKLPTPWRKLLVTVHVLTTVGVFGTDLVLLRLGAWSALGVEPRAVYPAAAFTLHKLSKWATSLKHSRRCCQVDATNHNR
jgi:hypothetical protein